jgi:hypothetical protein
MLVESGKDRIGNAGQGLDSGYLANIRFADFSTPATQAKLGVLNKPDFDYVNLGLLFPQDNTAEQVSIIQQMLHEKKLGSQLYLHVHYVQSVAQQPTFTAEYRYYNSNGASIPASFTTINTSDLGGNKGIFTYTSGSIMQYAQFPPIDAPVDENLSAHFEFRLYRNDNDVSGDVLVKFIDIHFEKDTDGSRGEFVK